MMWIYNELDDRMHGLEAFWDLVGHGPLRTASNHPAFIICHDKPELRLIVELLLPYMVIEVHGVITNDKGWMVGRSSQGTGRRGGGCWLKPRYRGD